VLVALQNRDAFGVNDVRVEIAFDANRIAFQQEEP
jgi:hypothetical protein